MTITQSIGFGVGMKLLFLFIPASFTVGVFGDQCITHQGKATTYNISNPTSNPTCQYSWADSDGTVLAHEGQPKNGSISSSYRSLTLTECLKKVCVDIDCPPKIYHRICCLTNCTTAPEPQANFTALPEPQEHVDPTTSSTPPPAVFWTPKVTGGIVVGTVIVVIVVVIAVVIAVDHCRKKENSWFEWFKRARCSSEPQSNGADARPEVIPMLNVGVALV